MDACCDIERNCIVSFDLNMVQAGDGFPKRRFHNQNHKQFFLERGSIVYSMAQAAFRGVKNWPPSESFLSAPFQ
jgi:hypothetical protein